MARKGSLTRKNREIQTLTQDNRVVLYVRASTPEQVNSLDAQKSSAARFALARGLEIDATFVGQGVSAVHCDLGDRPEAIAMFKHMKSRGIRSILVLKVDRAFRSIRDFTLTMAYADENGFAFRFIEPDVDYGSPAGKMFLHLQVALAEMECGIRSARVDGALDSLRDRRLSRNGASAPYGWQAVACTDGTKTRLGTGQFHHTPVAAEQAVLRHLLELWEIHQGHGGLTRIATIINDLGIPTKMAGKPMTKNGVTTLCSGIWQPATVKSVLEHAIVATDAELLDGLPTLTDAAAALRSRQTPVGSPDSSCNSASLSPCIPPTSASLVLHCTTQ